LFAVSFSLYAVPSTASARSRFCQCSINFTSRRAIMSPRNELSSH
jgi:hypothetical protein